MKIICAFFCTVLLVILSVGSPAFGFEHTVMIRVVYVTPQWVPYACTGGWTAAVPVKESSSLKYFEVAIWQENQSIHLYAFPNSYDPNYGTGKSDQEKIAYREQYALESFSGMPTDQAGKSLFIRNAMQAFVRRIAKEYSYSRYALYFSGHGSSGGTLFGGMLAPKHAQDLLAYWSKIIQHKLAFVDMGGPCNKGGYSDLNAFCPFSEYYIASDLPNGGYSFDSGSAEKYNETDPDQRYHDLLQNSGTLEEALKKRIDLKRTVYLYSRNNMTANKVEQANYLYSCAKFKKLYDIVQPIADALSPYQDLREQLTQYGAAYLQAFEDTIVYQADNRDFFAWEVAANGMLTPNSAGFTAELEQLSYPLLIFPKQQRPPLPAINLLLLKKEFCPWCPLF